MLTTARSPEIETTGFSHVSIDISRKDMPITTITFILFRTIWLWA